MAELENDIKVLEFPECVRRRAGMYIGSTENPNVILREVIDNSVDELLLPNSTNLIKINVNEETGECIVGDNGRGIPDKIDEKTGLSKVELAVSKLHAGGKFAKGKSASVGMNGVGTKTTCALSEVFEIWTSGLHLVFNRGIKVSEDRDWKLPEGFEGLSTVVRFIPDKEIFTKIVPEVPVENFKFTRLVCNELGKKDIHIIVNGVEDESVIELPKYKVSYGSVYKDVDGIEYPYKLSVNFDWEIGRTYEFHNGTVNGVHCPNGFHINWNENHLRAIIANALGIQDRNLLNLGLNFFVTVVASEVEYDSQTKVRLANIVGFSSDDCYPSYRSQLEEIVRSNKEFFDKLKKSIEIYADSAKRAQEVREINNLLQGTLMDNKKAERVKSKLAATSVKDCSTNDRKKAELYIVEGRSAAGPLIKARNAAIHSILPLRGKPKSVFKTNYKELLDNREWLNFVLTIGGGIDKLHDVSKVRYGKIIINCFTEDTKVPLLDGRVLNMKQIADELNEGKELFTYSVNDELGLPVPGRISNAGITGLTSVLIKITLDNGKVIECTPDHKFLTPDLTYIKAEDITEGTSLFPIYKKCRSEVGGYELMFVPSLGWVGTHSVMSGLAYMKALGDNNDCDTHHIDHNSRNNNPTNLEILNHKEHGKMHLIEYNQDPGRIEKLRELHRTGYYDHTYKYLIDWNKSKERVERLRRYWREGRLVSNGALTKFNQSEEHKNSMKAFNQSDWVKNLQQMGKIRSKFKKMLDSGMEYDDAIEKIKSEKYFYLFTDVDGFKAEFSKRNHKVTKIERIELDKPIDTYCITVPEVHNFLLDAGVVAHNCDSDPDGASIAISILGGIAAHMRYLIDNGLVYILETPLYQDTRNNTYYYPGEESKVEFGSGRIRRFKGLGEFNADQFKDFAFNVDKRRLVKVTPDNLDDALDLIRNTQPKKNLMFEKGYFGTGIITEDEFDNIKLEY